MTNVRNRVVILVAVVAVVATILACGTGGLISRNEPTATPTKTPKPTFTATLPPTMTLTPTNTVLPTDTPTPVPPTNTPVIMTATFTPLPTDTPTPVPPPTNTPKPTAKPKPKPTSTPKPPPPAPTSPPPPAYPWTGQVINTFKNCGLTRVFGFTLASNGALAGDQWVHYWADGWEGDWAKSGWQDFGAGTPYKGDEGNWDGTIDNRMRTGTWRVCVTDKEDSWTCISNTVNATTDADCVKGIQVVQMSFRKN